MNQQHSPRRRRIIRNLVIVAVLATGGTILTAASAGAATPDGGTVGCQRQSELERFAALGVVQPSRLWVNLPTWTAANATTYVRYWVTDGMGNAVVGQWYRSTTEKLLPNPYGAPYASGTREWYDQSSRKVWGLSDTLAHIRPGVAVKVTQEKIVYQNGRWSPSRWDLAGYAQC